MIGWNDIHRSEGNANSEWRSRSVSIGDMANGEVQIAGFHSSSSVNLKPAIKNRSRCRGVRLGGQAARRQRGTRGRA